MKTTVHVMMLAEIVCLDAKTDSMAKNVTTNAAVNV
jgi:hypothetical protein